LAVYGGHQKSAATKKLGVINALPGIQTYSCDHPALQLLRTVTVIIERERARERERVLLNPLSRRLALA